MIVFCVSGLWHGAGWTYLLWGALNGIYQVIGDQTKSWRHKINKKFSIKEESFSHHILQMLITFGLIDFAWIFFRATDVRSAFGFIARMVSTIQLSALFDGSLLNLGLDSTEFGIALIALLLQFLVSFFHKKGIHLRETLATQGIWLRWSVYLLAIYTVLIFGIYGPGFEASQFIYFQF
jgi:D-alanyl-lipoteichoic acid acyltransferase DltB (MBOAT superfamily)